ncbi:Crp/Fnr family transcriptional regulator [Haliovirga abyssi]|uniref:Crp/Fnr family transcriptional regulator n=1 Tax=Haliovirga abyssi TaxID=2996794 RepID=A0AAU9DLQ2_9FUSO|nr:Crp/Fnr family transcriptional regulator [Haliovirga abyssi]BDU50892.1 Crp/Fnr family transcriptional regulator [Haliovirga abyssi]
MDLEFLRDMVILEDLSEEDLLGLSKIVYTKTLKKGEILFFEGDKGDSMYIIKSGKVKILKLSEDGREKILSILSEGDFLGEMALLDSEMRSATVEAMEEIELYAIYKTEFLDFLKKNFSVTMHIIRTLSDRVRILNKKVEVLTFKDVYARFNETLKELSEKYGVVHKGTIKLNINLTHKDLANMLGVTRETVTRMIGKLKREGILDIQDKKIIILDIEKLENMKI